MGRLSTHVLDAAHGKPAQGVPIELHRIEASGHRALVARTATNSDGRTDAPLLAGAAYQTGAYEIVFVVGDYFRSTGLIPAGPAFLEAVPVRFQITDPDGSYHVPLVCSPWSYSTYRGS